MPRTGRPTRINEVIGHRDTEQGRTPITVADRIIEALNAGNYVEAAAAMAGVHKSSVYEWLSVGANATSALLAGAKTRRELTAHEKRCIDFSDAVEEAQHLADATDMTRLAALASGGQQVTETTEVAAVDAQGVVRVTERKTTTRTTLPDRAALTWRLERRNPEKYGRRTVELSGPDGGPIPVSVEKAGVDALMALAERMEAEDTTGDRTDDTEQ